jgi:hypothetical protein
MELLNISLRSVYFQLEDKFCQENEGMAKGNSLSPVVSSIFIEHFEEIALDAADHRPAKWLRYIDSTFVVWPRGPARLQQFLHHLNSLRPTIRFTMKVETNDTFPFLDILVMKRGPKLASNYKRQTHPLVRDSAPHQQTHNCLTVIKRQDWPTDHRL